MNKKANMKLIGSAVIIIILLVLAFVYIINLDDSQKEARSFCPDKYCIDKEEKCYVPRVVQGAICKDSLGGEERKCCATTSELSEKPEDDNNNIPNQGTVNNAENNTNNRLNNVIEIRLGASEEKINTGSSKSLGVGRTYEYTIWGEGSDASFCTINIVEPETGEITQDPGMSINIDKASCLQREGAQKITLRPEIPEKQYKLQVILYDVAEERIQSSILNFNTEGTTQTCPYTSCTMIPREQCLSPVQNCPNLRCEWQSEGLNGRCVTADI